MESWKNLKRNELINPAHQNEKANCPARRPFALHPYALNSLEL